MSTVENLEIVVDVDIASAVAALEELQDELREVATAIEGVDTVGTEGIDVETRVDQANAQFAMLAAHIAALDGSTIDVDTDFDRGRFTIPGWQRSGTRAGNVGELFDFMDFPGGREGRPLFGRLVSRAGDLSDRFEEFDLRMSDMHNMLARLVPLLLVFIGVIPAAVTALVGLAAAAVTAAASLAAIGGLGALGVALEDGELNMQNLTDMWEDVRDDFIEAFGPLAEELQPVFEDAVDGLGVFFDAVAAQGDALLELTDEARAFGGFLMEFVPGALRALAGLVEALSPIFADFGDFLSGNFESVMRTLVELTAETVPVIAEMALQIGRALPYIVRMSIGFAMVASAIIDFIGIIARLLGLLGIGGETFGVITAGVLAFASALALANLVMGTFITSTIVGAVSALYGFFLGIMSANSAMTYFINTTVVGAVASIYSFISSLLAGEIAMFSFSASVFTATGAMAAFLTLATLGAAAALIGVAITAASEFLGLAGSIDSASNSLKEFNRLSGQTQSQFGGEGDDPYGFDPDNPDTRGGGSSGVTVFNVESGGDAEEDRSNLEHADWLSGRTTGGG